MTITVKKLIQKLQTMNQESEVILCFKKNDLYLRHTGVETVKHIFDMLRYESRKDIIINTHDISSYLDDAMKKLQEHIDMLQNSIVEIQDSDELTEIGKEKRIKEIQPFIEKYKEEIQKIQNEPIEDLRDYVEIRFND